MRGFEMFDRQRVNKVNTPCFIYNIESIGKRIEVIRTAFKGTSYTQYYPVKANPCFDIVRYCIKNGLGIDACSMGDIEIADILNVQSENISFTGVGLSEQDMRYLYRKKITPNLSSLEEIKRWARIFPDSRIGIRLSTLTPGIEFKNEYSLKMGIFPGEWSKVRDVVLKNNLEIIKLHRHESNNSISHEELLNAFSAAFAGLPGWVWQKVKTINYGGGWGLPYSRKGQLDAEKLIHGIVDLTKRLKAYSPSGELKIEIEPGEFMVGECGYLLTKVVNVRNLNSYNKMRDNLQVVILDTPFPVTSGSRTPELLYNVKFNLDDKEKKKETFFTKIYGRSNTSMDTVNKGIYLPAVKVDTLALVHGVGAYVPVLLSHFNQQDIPAEFVFKNDTLVKSRDTLKFRFHYRYTYLQGEDNERI
jgi:diaminopimelate decarboxylase